MTRIGLEAGPLSQWLYAGMREAGLAVELLETRHVRDAFKAMPVKTDRKDARGIAQLMRLGWFRSVHCKSLRRAGDAGAADRAQAGAIEAPRRGDEPAWRPAWLRAEGRGDDAQDIRRPGPRARVWSSDAAVGCGSLVGGASDTRRSAAEAGEAGALRGPRQYGLTRLLMSAPGVGAIVALTYVAAIDDPARFKSSKATGATFGLSVHPRTC